MMKTNYYIGLVLAMFILIPTEGSMVFAQAKKNTTGEKWEVIVDDETTTISYNPNITITKSGDHVVWVKVVFKTKDWQEYMGSQIGSRQLVKMTKTKVQYDSRYNYALVRQVLCFNNAGKQIFNTGDDTSAGWAPVNASDPVGIVGEYLGDKLREEEIFGF